MLNLDDNSRWRLDVGEMDLSVRRRVRNLSTVFRKVVFPSSMPFRLTLPPRITVSPPCMRPMMKNARPALSNGQCAADRAYTAPAKEGILEPAVDQSVLHEWRLYSQLDGLS